MYQAKTLISVTPRSIEIPPSSVSTVYPAQLMHYQCAKKKCKWDLNEFLQFVTVRKQYWWTNLRKYWCMNGRITSESCVKVSMGKCFNDSDWYSQKEQKVMEKSFVLFLDCSLCQVCMYLTSFKWFRTLQKSPHTGEWGEGDEQTVMNLSTQSMPCQTFSAKVEGIVCEKSVGNSHRKLGFSFVAACHFLVALQPPFIVILPGCPWKLFESEPAVTHFFPM